MKLYKYIFSRAYYFCIRVFKEKDFPQFFASIVISMIFVGSIIVVLELIEYLMLPTVINIYGDYHGYFSLTMLVGIAFFINRNGYYSVILKEYEAMTAEERKTLGLWSWIYTGVLLFGFFYLGYLLREYGINH